MSRPTKEKQHLMDKYKEIVIDLFVRLNYSYEDIGTIMNRTRPVIKRICDGKDAEPEE